MDSSLIVEDYKTEVTMTVQTKENLEVKINDLGYLSISELINKSLENNPNETINIFKQELIKRGKDNIYTRIEIKKSCKGNISSLEDLIKEYKEKKLNDNNILSALKIKLLDIVSLIDRLQLEWQKYDLRH